MCILFNKQKIYDSMFVIILSNSKIIFIVGF